MKYVTGQFLVPSDTTKVYSVMEVVSNLTKHSMNTIFFFTLPYTFIFVHAA